MNIFVLSTDPEEAAQMACDQHVIKMILESTQLLATALRFHGAPDEVLPRTASGTPYKSTHHNHPCSVWTRKTRANFLWLVEHVRALSEEYTIRFGKVHACSKWIDTMHRGSAWIPDGELTEFARAMPDQYKDETSVVRSYRAFYCGEKLSFAKWKRNGDWVNEWKGKACAISMMG